MPAKAVPRRNWASFGIEFACGGELARNVLDNDVLAVDGPGLRRSKLRRKIFQKFAQVLPKSADKSSMGGNDAAQTKRGIVKIKYLPWTAPSKLIEYWRKRGYTIVFVADTDL